MLFGLKNLGATCFINAALQLLLRLGVENIKTRDPLLYLIAKIASEKQKVVTPTHIVKLIYENYPDLRPFHQGDCSEMLSRLLLRICDETNRAKGPYGTQPDHPDLTRFLEGAREAYARGMDSDFERRICVQELQTTACECGFASRALNFANGLYLDIIAPKREFQEDEDDKKVAFMLIVPKCGVCRMDFNLADLQEDVVISNIAEQLARSLEQAKEKLDCPVFSFYDMELDCVGLRAIITQINRFYEISASQNEQNEYIEIDEAVEEPELADSNTGPSRDTPSTQPDTPSLIDCSNMMELDSQMQLEFGMPYKQIVGCITKNIDDYGAEHLVIVTATEAFYSAKTLERRMVTVSLAEYSYISVCVPFPGPYESELLKKQKPEEFRQLVFYNLVPTCAAFFCDKVKKLLLNPKERKNYSIDLQITGTMLSVKISSQKLMIQCRKREADVDVLVSFLKAENRKAHNLITLYECLAHYLQPQKVEGWRCSKCGEHEKGQKQIRILETGAYLFISLKRFQTVFSQYGDLEVTKNYASVRFGDVLELNEQQYLLRGFTCHYGSLEAGHYVACIYEKNAWYECNDDAVEELSAQQVQRLKSDAQSLFYVKK